MPGLRALAKTWRAADRAARGRAWARYNRNCKRRTNTVPECRESSARRFAPGPNDLRVSRIRQVRLTHRRPACLPPRFDALLECVATRRRRAGDSVRRARRVQGLGPADAACCARPGRGGARRSRRPLRVMERCWRTGWEGDTSPLAPHGLLKCNKKGAGCRRSGTTARCASLAASYLNHQTIRWPVSAATRSTEAFAERLDARDHVS